MMEDARDVGQSLIKGNQKGNPFFSFLGHLLQGGQPAEALHLVEGQLDAGLVVPPLQKFFTLLGQVSFKEGLCTLNSFQPVGKGVGNVLGYVRWVTARWRQILHHSPWLGIQSGLINVTTEDKCIIILKNDINKLRLNLICPPGTHLFAKCSK